MRVLLLLHSYSYSCMTQALVASQGQAAAPLGWGGVEAEAPMAPLLPPFGF
jgi:hypothetical protein